MKVLESTGKYRTCPPGHSNPSGIVPYFQVLTRTCRYHVTQRLARDTYRSATYPQA